MKQVFSAARRNIVHDLDGVHYDYALIPDLYPFLAENKIAAARELCPRILSELGEDEFIRKGVESYHKSGDGLLVFVDMAVERMGVDRSWFQEAFHRAYNRHNFERTLKHHPQVFDPCNQTRIFMERLHQAGFVHALLTQSCLESWAQPMLERMGRLQFISPDARMGFAEGGYVCRGHNGGPFLIMLEKLEARPDEVIIIDDSLDNLAIAKHVDDRLLTVHINRNAHQQMPAYVDYEFKSLLKALEAVELHCAPKSPQPQGLELHV